MPLPLSADTATLEDVTMHSAAGENVVNGRDGAHSDPHPISGRSPTTRYTRQRAMSSPASVDAPDRDATDDDSQTKAIS